MAADYIIVIGQRTGHSASLEKIDGIGSATHLPLLMGSGADGDDALAILERTNGVIVASSLNEGDVW